MQSRCVILKTTSSFEFPVCEITIKIVAYSEKHFFYDIEKLDKDIEELNEKFTSSENLDEE